VSAPLRCAAPGVVARLLTMLVRIYQRTSVVRAPRCRFHPTCSSYAIEAIDVHGPARGSWLALRRIGRCHPFHPGGVDRVPRRTTDLSLAPSGHAEEATSLGIRPTA